MNSWAAISRTEHAQSHWRPRKDFEFTAAQQIVPVIITELTKLLPHYVLGFVQTENDAYQAVALVGLGGERNLYISADSKWLCSYVPAALRAYPFALHKNTNEKETNENAILCIDELFINDDEAFPRLFKDDGELEDKAAEVLDFVTQCEQNRQLTDTAAAALATAGIIEPWPISIGRGEGQEPLKINGMHRINEEALNKLDAEALSGLDFGGISAGIRPVVLYCPDGPTDQPGRIPCQGKRAGFAVRGSKWIVQQRRFRLTELRRIRLC